MRGKGLRKSTTGAAVVDQLRAYRALDNPLRLRAYTAIHDQPELSFNELARKLGVESGLTAYHVGVLKSAGLIDVEYVRKSRETSEYRLTPKGQTIYKHLFLKSWSGRKKGKKAKK